MLWPNQVGGHDPPELIRVCDGSYGVMGLSTCLSAQWVILLCWSALRGEMTTISKCNSAIRHVAERLSRQRVLLRRLPPQFGGGKFYVSPDAGLKYLRPAYWKAEPVLFQMVSELVHPGAPTCHFAIRISLGAASG